MTAKLLVGPAGSGKTHQSIQRVLEVLSEDPLGPIWVVVPDRYQAYAFRRRLGTAGGAIGVHVGTFGHLYNEILWTANTPIPVASVPVIHRLIRAALQNVQAEHGLKHYGPIAEMPGFLRAIRSTIAELKLARVWPEVFLELVEGHDPALTEIAQIYTEYQSSLGEIGWADPEGVNWLATEALESDSSLFAHCPLLVVDGFDSFEGAQRSALGLLSQRTPELLITLPGTYPMTRTAHRRFAKTLEQLTRDVSLEIDAILDVSRLPSVIAHIEKSLFEPETGQISADGSIVMIEVRSPREEAREAVRWVKSRILRHGLSAYACAIVTPDPERYRPFLREAGHEFGVPIRFTHGESLSSAPGIRALLDLLGLPLRGFPSRLTIEAIRSPYFDLRDYGLKHEDADLLENASRHGLVIEGLEQWEEALTNLSVAKPIYEEQDDSDLQGSELPKGEKATTLLVGLQDFTARITPPASLTLANWVSWLEDLLDDLSFLKRDQTARDQASLVGLREVLRALVLGEAIVEGMPISVGAFLLTLRSFLDGTYYHETQNWKDPAVLVLRVFEARGLRYKAVALLGLSEGLFPEVEREDPFLSEDVRNQLGLEGRLGREQGGIFYQIITRADEHLFITRPYLAEDGEYWEASPYWSDVVELIDEDPITLRHESPRALSEAGSSGELLFWGVRRAGLPPHIVEDLESRWEYLRHARNVLQARMERAPEGRFEGYSTGLSSVLNDRYGPDQPWSSSRLETFGSCPYRFYIESTVELEVKESPELGIDARQLGSMLHEALEMAYKRATDPGDVDQVRVLLDQVIEEVFSQAPTAYGFRPTHLWAVEQDQFAQALRDSFNNLEELDSGWTPIAFEQPFGLEGAPSLEMQIGDEKILVRGLIDRVDRNDAGELRVVDYKTGSSHLASRDLVEGRRLQLPIYAVAAEEALGLGDPIEGLYWAILAGKAGQLRLSKFQPKRDAPTVVGPSVAISVMKEHVEKYVTAIRHGEFPPIPPRDGCPDFCAAAAWCWRYSPAGW
jgi:ATP-dependent helicase/DNAse subunit B